MARRYWPDKRPIGRRFRLGEGGPIVEIVGAVADSRLAGLREAAEPECYVRYRQEPWAATSLVIRTRLDTGAMSAALSEVIHDLDAALAVPAAPPVVGIRECRDCQGATGGARNHRLLSR
jgi:putative ABC transport system permease protein